MSRRYTQSLKGDYDATIWEIRWIQFPYEETFEKVNKPLANIAAGWEPFAALSNPEQGWRLFLKRRKD